MLNIRDSDLSLNSIALIITTPNAQVNVDNVRFASNFTGIRADAGIARMMKSTFFGNAIGIHPLGGSICSAGDSRFAWSAFNGTPSANTGPCAITTQ